MEQKGNKKGLLAVIALAAAVLALGGVYLWTRPEVSKGDKHIVVEVVHADGASKEFAYDTDAEYLRDVLEPAGLIAGDDSEYGLFVKTVNGITADYDKDGVYWAFYVNGEYAATGVDATKVTEGESYAFKVE